MNTADISSQHHDAHHIKQFVNLFCGCESFFFSISTRAGEFFCETKDSSLHRNNVKKLNEKNADMDYHAVFPLETTSEREDVSAISKTINSPKRRLEHHQDPCRPEATGAASSSERLDTMRDLLHVGKEKFTLHIWRFCFSREKDDPPRKFGV